MKVHKIDKFIKGWFIGNFEPSLFNTDDFEICFKRFRAGEKESVHYHKIAVEYTLVTSGKISMNGNEYEEGDIIVVEPGEVVEFVSLVDSSIIAVKVPCVKNDKYEV